MNGKKTPVAWTRRIASAVSAVFLMLSGCLRHLPPPPESPAAPSSAARAEAHASTEAPIEIPPGPERPDVASPRRVEQPWMSLSEWRRRHEQQLHFPGRERAALVVLGDSIVEGWCQSAAFHQTFGDLQPLNLGLGGDQTQHVLWRIEQGVLDGLAPRAAILLIGVNNLGNGFSPDDTLLGVRAVAARVREKLPATPLLVLRVLPAGESADDGLRRKIAALNSELSVLEQLGKIRVVEVGSVFLEADGRILKTQMGDFLHPTALGYERLSRAVRPVLDEVLAK